jgi:hypothetical protein
LRFFTSGPGRLANEIIWPDRSKRRKILRFTSFDKSATSDDVLLHNRFECMSACIGEHLKIMVQHNLVDEEKKIRQAAGNAG